jgi:glycerophosphoryl diester phosphodiesterase
MGGRIGRRAAITAARVMSIAAPATAPAAEAAPAIAAHRGGPILDGVPGYAENTLPAFAAAAARGDVLEFDVHVTRDGVPVVVHDDTLDRVTDCKGLGPIGTLTLAQVRACPVTWLGRPGETPALPSAPNPDPTPIPTLAQVLALARATGATVSPEIKNIPPTDGAALAASDFDATGTFALRVAQALKASGLPQERMIVQSFWPPNLDLARLVLPRAQLSLLTLKALNAGGPALAAGLGYGWVSPDFGTGLDAGYVGLAHALGRKVTVYTVDTPELVRAARDQGVDAIITDDPVMARAAL